MFIDGFLSLFQEDGVGPGDAALVVHDLDGAANGHGKVGQRAGAALLDARVGQDLADLGNAGLVLGLLLLGGVVLGVLGEVTKVAGLLEALDDLLVLLALAVLELGDELLISASTLRAEGDLFLCGMTPDELAAALHTPITPVAADGAALLSALLGKNEG